MEAPTHSPDLNDIPITLKEFSKRHTYPSLSALRRMVFDSEINGLKTAFLKVGRRRLILPKTFFELLTKMGRKI